MTPFDFKKRVIPNFVGRTKELDWLENRIMDKGRSLTPLVISGMGGIGKTALVQYWLSTSKAPHTPLWLDLSGDPQPKDSINLLVKSLHQIRNSPPIIVVIDGTEGLTDKEHAESAGAIFNYKAVKSLIFISRQSIGLKRFESLMLNSLPRDEAITLLKQVLSKEHNQTELLAAYHATQGFPLAIGLLGRLVKDSEPASISAILSKPLYSLAENTLAPERKIIELVKPTIVLANHRIISLLQRQPSDLYQISPRQFEELIAELLADMGWVVELTKQTRDGGADILAFLNTPIGKLLCIVEAKHYREERRIGVELVRNLYGTLCDSQASSAMLVTSSSFTKDAKAFQQRHEYQLSLRDFSDIVGWIQKYGQRSAISQNPNLGFIF